MKTRQFVAKLLTIVLVLSVTTGAFAAADTYVYWNEFNTIREGANGGKVRAVQNITKYYLGIGPSYTADGAFGALTTRYVKQFQESVGITSDGIVGPDTWQYLRAMITESDGGFADDFDEYFRITFKTGGRTNTNFFHAVSTATGYYPAPPWYWYTYKAEPGSTPGAWYSF